MLPELRAAILNLADDDAGRFEVESLLKELHNARIAKLIQAEPYVKMAALHGGPAQPMQKEAAVGMLENRTHRWLG
jgi:hypothetical protein